MGFLVLAALLGGAPFQCSSDPDPTTALEETAGEALYQLAEQFRGEGRREAWLRTLTYLVDRYPSSRFAEMARQDLAAVGAGPPAKGSSSP